MRFNTEVQGLGHMIKVIIKMSWAYKRTLLYLFKKKGIRAAMNFIYVKTLVPTGEGAGAAAYFLITWEGWYRRNGWWILWRPFIWFKRMCPMYSFG